MKFRFRPNKEGQIKNSKKRNRVAFALFWICGVIVPATFIYIADRSLPTSRDWTMNPWIQLDVAIFLVSVQLIVLTSLQNICYGIVPSFSKLLCFLSFVAYLMCMGFDQLLPHTPALSKLDQLPAPAYLSYETGECVHMKTNPQKGK